MFSFSFSMQLLYHLWLVGLFKQFLFICFVLVLSRMLPSMIHCCLIQLVFHGQLLVTVLHLYQRNWLQYCNVPYWKLVCTLKYRLKKELLMFYVPNVGCRDWEGKQNLNLNISETPLVLLNINKDKTDMFPSSLELCESHWATVHGRNKCCRS